MIKAEILTPLLNTNEPEARLVAIHVADGEKIVKGTLLFTVETTKSTEEITAPETGFIHLLARVGDSLAVGDRMAVITETKDEKVDVRTEEKEELHVGGRLRITNPARALAKTLGLDLGTMPTDTIVTEDIVRQMAAAKQPLDLDLADTGKPYLIVFGGGGHAKTLMDLIKQAGMYDMAGIVDDRIPKGTLIMGIPVLGAREVLPSLISKGVKLAANGVGGILDISVRVRIFDFLGQSGFKFPTLVHPRATVEPSARVGEGAQVFANAYVGTEAMLEPKCMVNTNAVVSHDCIIGAFSHIAPGALLAGHVQVGVGTLVGMGVTTAIGVKIGAGVRIGNGAIVLADVPDRTIIQAGRYWVGKAGKALDQG